MNHVVFWPRGFPVSLDVAAKFRECTSEYVKELGSMVIKVMIVLNLLSKMIVDLVFSIRLRILDTGKYIFEDVYAIKLSLSSSNLDRGVAGGYVLKPGVYECSADITLMSSYSSSVFLLFGSESDPPSSPLFSAAFALLHRLPQILCLGGSDPPALGYC